MADGDSVYPAVKSDCSMSALVQESPASPVEGRAGDAGAARPLATDSVASGASSAIGGRNAARPSDGKSGASPQAISDAAHVDPIRNFAARAIWLLDGILDGTRRNLSSIQEAADYVRAIERQWYDHLEKVDRKGGAAPLVGVGLTDKSAPGDDHG